MTALRAIATMIFPFFLTSSVFCQFGPGKNAVPFGDRRGDPDAGLRNNLRAYDRIIARGNDKAAAQTAFSIASIYERREDYVNAETWYRTCDSKGQIECSKNFIDLILLNKVTINDTSAIRPFVEARAVCGSSIARQYAFAAWHETAAQLPVIQNQTLTTCGPVGPADRMEPNLAIAARRIQEKQQLAE